MIVLFCLIMSIILSAPIDSQSLLDTTYEFLDEKVDFDVSFSDTKTSHKMLKELFK